ncbi:TMAO reductase system periplasmic protein TorT [Corticibacterium sp. UT-5YL-CI-8]|nr:TMAO reductase system periplasmic protein TorT [Tianweitania sp. UT-5YL-CI-8]
MKTNACAKMALALSTAVLVAAPANAEDKWYPAMVDVWDPPFNAENKIIQEEYVPLDKAEKAWKICVSYPHLKDSYWLASNYGVIAEARRLGVQIQLVEAGGYTNLDKQLSQVEDCVAAGAEAVVLSAISADAVKGLVDNLRSKGVPVIDLVNGINTTVDAKSLQNYYNLGKLACGYIVEDAAGQEKTIGMFPGPAGAGWAVDTNKGCVAALEGTKIKVVATRWGDTGKEAQQRLIEDVLQAQTSGAKIDLDYIFGANPAAEAAVAPLRERGLSEQVKVFSMSYGIGSQRDLERNAIAGAVSDRPVTQARIAVDQTVRILEKKPLRQHVGALMSMVTKKELDDGSFDTTTTLAPSDWKPVFSTP